MYRASGAGLGDKVIREMNFSDKQIFPLQDVALSDVRFTPSITFMLL